MRRSPLHIGVDGRELLGRPTGVGRYLFQVLQAWASDASWPHRVSVILPETPPEAVVAAFGNRIGWTVAPGPSSGTTWEQWQLPLALRRIGIDVLLAGAYTAPVVRVCPFVVIVYDVSFFAHPEWFRKREGLRRRVLTKRAARHATEVITISEFSASEIVHWTGVPRDRITLAAPGAPAVIRTASAGRDPVVLFVGSLFTRRHVPDLIHGFALAVADVPDARLVLVGDNRTEPKIDPRAVATAAGVGDRVVWREYVTDAELDALYESARVFAFLSDYEGFAMTPLEAIAHGVVPVLLDTAVAHEVYGDAAAYVAADQAAIGGALTRLLTDGGARGQHLHAGRERLRQFSWTDTAATISAALERAAGPVPPAAPASAAP